jgi:homoserine kinase
MSASSIRVRVPATSANLGPGFDCLGLALSLHNSVEFTVADGDTSIEVGGHGQGNLDLDENNLVISTAKFLYRELGHTLPHLRLVCENGIPLSSGLGSSAAAIVSGLTGANALLGRPLDSNAIIELGSRLEGHPDNVAACVLGGLVVVRRDAAEIRTIAYDLPQQTAVVVVPKMDLTTERMRGILPKQVDRESAVHNLASVPFVVEALRHADYDMLAYAVEDRLHEVHRLSFIPGGESAKRAALGTGAAAVVLSGAGPALLAFAPSGHSTIAQAMVEAFRAEGLAASDFNLEIGARGTTVSPA